ncbi:MAG: AI-2E family transporter, partial [Burkholderiales bacterium]|nr:AI-2E family transporter [Burkholderiales bacterium]
MPTRKNRQQASPKNKPSPAAAVSLPSPPPAELPPTPLPAPFFTVFWQRYVWFIVAGVLFIALIIALKSVLTPFFAGALLAYLGSPMVARITRPRAIQKLKCSRTLGALVVLHFMLAFCALLFFLIVPLIQSEVVAIQHQLPALWNTFLTQRLPAIEAFIGVSLTPNLETLRQFLTDHVGDVSQISFLALSGLSDSGLAVFNGLINLILTPVVMFYLLRDGHLLTAQIKSLIPPRFYSKTAAMAQEIDSVLSEFIRGQALVMLLLAVYYGVALRLAGLSFAWSIGLLTGLLVFIPYVGFTLGLLLATLTAILQPTYTWALTFWVIGIYGLGQIIEGYILVPYLIGDKIGLHPLAVIFALL